MAERSGMPDGCKVSLDHVCTEPTYAAAHRHRVPAGRPATSQWEGEPCQARIGTHEPGGCPRLFDDLREGW